mmetsp:Transcript_99963/g.177359  ORF Transcript_99963/g.177359 Transcript_99963/m.177359 type:complete len:326 (-) Transcript_99963:76-1053(-)
MRGAVFVLTCLAFSGNAHGRGSGASDSLEAVASLLATFNPAAALKPSAAGMSAPAASLRAARAPQLSAGRGSFDRRNVLLQACLAAGTCLTQPRQAVAISATTMAGKSKPALGVILVDAPQQTGKTISGEVILNGGLIAQLAFETPWGLATGGYYDMEASPGKARGGSGEAAFVAVSTLPAGETLSSVPKDFFNKALLDVTGRYGSYGAPSEVKWKGVGDSSDAVRKLKVSFNTASPNNVDVPRKGIVTALKTEGSQDVVMLMSSTTASRWGEGGEQEAGQAAQTFRIASTRKTKLEAKDSNDYREIKKEIQDNDYKELKKDFAR